MQSFTGGQIEEQEDQLRAIWTFKILIPERKAPLVAIANELIDDNSAEEIKALLHGWRVADVMRANAERRVVVTRAGLRFEERE